MSNSALLQRRLAILKTEVSLDFPELLPLLEKGERTIVFSGHPLTSSLNSDVLRRIGGMLLICQHYGANVIFLTEGKYLEFRRDSPAED